MTDKPPFDPNAPFTPGIGSDVSGKPAFDPTAPFSTSPPEGGGPMSWSDVGSQAIGNIPASAKRFASDIAQPFLHPMQTAENIGNVGHGLAQKLGVAPEGGEEDIPKWNAVAEFFKNRYGGLENIKKSIAEDPVGVAGDLSTILTGGETALARAPGIIGKVGEIAGTAGRVLDPLSIPAAAARGAKELVGVQSGVGKAPLEQAFQAGLEGGTKASDFRAHITGNADMADVVGDARASLGQMRKERGAAYRQQMADLGTDKTILSWNDVDTALADMDKVATYKGQSLSPSTEAMRDKINATIDDWKNLRASEFWTPEGFDALKKKVGDLRDSSQFGTPERVVADQAYQAIKKTIADQAPQYSRIMSGYEEASKQLKEIETTLSLRPGTNIDTALRKLQSTLRDNVNTNFGRRAQLADYLVNAGAPNLLAKLAGQALQPLAPRGLARLVAGEAIPAAAAGALGGYAAHGVGAGALTGGLGMLATLPMMSPRLMGEAAYGLGAAHRMTRSATVPLAKSLRPARAIGRLNEPLNPYNP